MRAQEDILDERNERPVTDYRPKNDDDNDYDKEWSDRDFGIDEDIDPADRRRDPLRR